MLQVVTLAGRVVVAVECSMTGLATDAIEKTKLSVSNVSIWA